MAALAEIVTFILDILSDVIYFSVKHLLLFLIL